RTTQIKEDLRTTLEKLGYPSEIIPTLLDALETMFYNIQIDIFKSRIDAIAGLKEKDPGRYVAQLKAILRDDPLHRDLYTAINNSGFLNFDNPHTLIKLIARGLNPEEDIFETIKRMNNVSEKDKTYLTQFLTACSGHFLLEYIILNYLGLDVMTVVGPDHVAPVLDIGNNKVLFIDFVLDVVRVVDLSGHYIVPADGRGYLGSYLILQSQKRMPSDTTAIVQVNAMLGKISLSSLSDRTILNAYYLEIYIVHKIPTAITHNSRGRVYYDLALKLKGDDKETRDNRKSLLDKAKAEFKKAAEIDPGYLKAHNNLAATYKELGMLDEAEKIFRRVIELNPAYAMAHHNLARTLFQAGKRREAEKEFKEAIKLDPGLVLAHSQLAILYLRSGRLLDAANELKAAIKLDPSRKEEKTLLDSILTQLQDNRNSIERYRSMLDRNPNDIMSLYEIGLLQNSVGDYVEAVKSLEKARRLKPDFSETHVQLGWIYYRLDRADDAIENWIKGERLRRKNKMPSILPELPDELRGKVETKIDAETNMPVGAHIKRSTDRSL
ncbi:MAG: tetratricopeptide repeat protein, partial [Candidatus Omnitrophota bacterium]|nr:tetratricopeptide repeat protein [Candidatus Omnitrophota bacterium]